ncbi:MAG: glycerol-3-phosphate 1-O-acyltransferase PlsY [Oscillospiraceae bacterium]|jgi:glycerol-3-phosphate acyltransferase PlsY|nr:glycerol-3-phosphate 1-O-acyltransferase PlsY [Oscillospiraceae bacterium]
MDALWLYFTAAVSAYLLGSLNGSLMMSRWFLRDDIRKYGSGNAGATNVLRTYGVRWTVAVSLWDVGKGVLAVWIGRLLQPDAGYAALLAGFLVIIGHVFPLFFKFRGGKGVITACGVLFALDWQTASIALGLFLILLILTRYLSLGSICAVFTLPFLGLFFRREWAAVGMYASVAVLVILLHRANIRRLLGGTENKFPRNKSTSE